MSGGGRDLPNGPNVGEGSAPLSGSLSTPPAGGPWLLRPAGSESRQAQASLAEAHGISAFCYYHYWFNGRRLLERPFDEVLLSGAPKLPFCLCWANESWTRRWDGEDDHALIQQTYSVEDDVRHVEYFSECSAMTATSRSTTGRFSSCTGLANCRTRARDCRIWRDRARAGASEASIS